MSGGLRIRIGQHTDRGRKDRNQDFHGALVPEEPLQTSKGIPIALADGISTSDVSHVAAESVVKALMTDYFCTSEAWTVKKSAQRVLEATNSWLHAQTRRSQYRYDQDRGFVCTLTAMIVKSNTAHLFHVGDSRIYRIAGNSLEQLTNDHRMVVTAGHSYLSRAMGAAPQVEIDYREVPLAEGDVFLLATDGVYEHVSPGFAIQALALHSGDLDAAAAAIVAEALDRGSPDNLTLQIVAIDALPPRQAGEVVTQETDLPCPPILDAGSLFDGYRILRPIHSSSRSHIYLATDLDSGATVVIKTPSIDLRGDPAYLKRFLMEEWIARRVNSAHVLKASPQKRLRKFLYTVTEHIDGQTLTQWMADNPHPPLETVRGIVEQIARGLRAFHRMEMLHQDLRPENVMIDAAGTVRIIDFGSTRVAGVMETAPAGQDAEILGTVQYTAPEYFLGEPGTVRSDIFSLGVITYQMLTGRLPFGTEVAKTRTRSAQRKLRYRSALDAEREIPAWIDPVLKKAVAPDPNERYAELSEFTHELRHPGKDYLPPETLPLLERDPLVFWKVLSLVLMAAVVALLAGHPIITGR